MARIRTRQQLLMAVSSALGDRKLVFFGTRGTDAGPLVEVPQFSFLFTQISPLDAIGSIDEQCLESMRHMRPDLDTYNIDNDNTKEVEDFRRAALQVLSEYCAVIAYRPTKLLMDVLYPRLETARYLGMFYGQQAAFEHKAWVETQLHRFGVKTLPWRYYADSEKGLIAELMAARKVVRANRTDGGAGVAVLGVGHPDLPPHDDRFIGATEFLEGAIPLNINGCLFPSGEATLHGASFQLIGLPSCTTRQFGYCGNDFAALARLEKRTVRQFAEMATATSRWLASMGYIGAFGIDALLHEGTLYLTEVNPRFQGSSCLTSELDAHQDLPDLHLCHLGAFLGLPCPQQPPLEDVVASHPQRAHVIIHNMTPEPLQLFMNISLPGFRLDQLPSHEVQVQPNGILFEMVADGLLTVDGSRITAEAERTIAAARKAFHPPQPGLPFPVFY